MTKIVDKFIITYYYVYKGHNIRPDYRRFVMEIQEFKKFCKKWDLRECCWGSLHFFQNECEAVAQIRGEKC